MRGKSAYIWHQHDGRRAREDTMRIFEAMLDCGIHRRLDTPIEGQREIVTILKEGQKERNDILKETNALLQEILEKVKVRYPNGVAPAAPSCMPEP